MRLKKNRKSRFFPPTSDAQPHVTPGLSAETHRSMIQEGTRQGNFAALDELHRQQYLQLQERLQALVPLSHAALRKAANSPKTSRSTLVRIANFLFSRAEQTDPALRDSQATLPVSKKKYPFS